MTDKDGPINSDDMKFSKNEYAERIAGHREIPFGVFILNAPAEEGYHCPVCEYENVVNDEFDMRLDWSEYNGFLYCSVCNRDYPTCLCIPDNIEKATKIYLATVEEAIKNHDRA